ncbi:MAG: DivIVA domain-containing protein [Candidatus Kryptoniota bacterium]
MRLTPLQIRNQKFRKTFSGYNPGEVDAFLSTVAGDFENLLKENLDLRSQKNALAEELQSYKKIEDSLRALVEKAEKAAKDSAEAVQRTSRIIQHEAELKAEQILKEANSELDRAKARLEEVTNLRETIIKTIRTILTAQLDMLSSMEGEFIKQEPTSQVLDIKTIIESIEKSGK